MLHVIHEHLQHDADDVGVLVNYLVSYVFGQGQCPVDVGQDAQLLIVLLVHLGQLRNYVADVGA